MAAKQSTIRNLKNQQKSNRNPMEPGEPFEKDCTFFSYTDNTHTHRQYTNMHRAHNIPYEANHNFKMTLSCLQNCCSKESLTHFNRNICF